VKTYEEEEKFNQLNIVPFDASYNLDNKETFAEYLSMALIKPDPDAFP
jgi:hypothetical protein